MNINERTDELKEEIISSVQEIIRVKSVGGKNEGPGMPFGKGPAEALECALEISKKLGFKTVNLDGYVGYAEIGEGEDYVAVLGHVDVVPEGTGWDYAPYGGEIADGKIYGRGTNDDKGPIIAGLYAAKVAAESGENLSKRIRVIFGTNEERGSDDLPYYNAREKQPVFAFTPDAHFPIINGEKGIVNITLSKAVENVALGNTTIKYVKGGSAANMIPANAEAAINTDNHLDLINLVEEYAERRNVKLTAEYKDGLVYIKSKGKQGHGSTPEVGINAVMQLVCFLDTLDLPKDDIREYISFLSKNIGMEINGESLGCGLRDDVSNLTSNVGVLEINDNVAKTVVNLRYPVTKTFDEMMDPIKEKVANTGIEILDVLHSEPLYFDPKHPLIKTLSDAYTEVTGERAELISIGGGTYAKSMANTVAFGPLFPGREDVNHQSNEYITIEDLMACTKIYANAIIKLAK